MSFVFQINDPDQFQTVVQVPGKYNPDILEDGKRRCVDMYREALNARLEAHGRYASYSDDSGEGEA